MITFALILSVNCCGALLGLSLASRTARLTGMAGSAKLASFECGFLHFSDARQKFNVSFYLVGILFILFDIEVTLLVPWTIVSDLPCCAFAAVTEQIPVAAVTAFLLVLAAGFLLEFSKGAFD